MSSSRGSVCLLVLLGAVVAFGSPVFDNLKRTHESIADVLELKKPEVASNHLFSSVIRSINTSCQRKEEVQLMNVTLDIYMQIFSSILQPNHHTPTLLDQLSDTERSKVESSLIDLQQELQKLKRQLSHPSHPNHNKEDVLSKLNKIRVDDPEVQRKALAQLKEVYQAASVIGSHRC